jgi:hypothetical protein
MRSRCCVCVWLCIRPIVASNCLVKVPLWLLGNDSVQITLSLIGNGSVHIPLSLKGNGSVERHRGNE